MRSQDQKQCRYIDPNAHRCTGDVESRGLCYWHNPDIAKTGDDVKQRLEAYAKSGRSMAGFSLKYANLEGIRLIVPGKNAGLNLTYADLYHANLRNAHLFHIDLYGSSLMKADLYCANLNCANLEKANLLGTNFKNAKIEHISWGEYIVQEEKAHATLKQKNLNEALNCFEQAEEIYRGLRKTYEARGLFEHAGIFFYREMIMRRFQIPKFSFKRLLSKMVDIFCGYGEKPLRVVIFSWMLILISAILYFSFGINGKDTIIVFDSQLNIQQNIHNFINCLYFSVVTFTTLGYGDLSPLGLTKFIAACEAFTGAFTIALFVVVFVKKMTR
ncbi:ion channel [Candidatus Parabeggiatoa sp. HSG14]|uniref:ion channel n=1 Tax=Candidatus Parabeggiatoa sp. HSG14 TaxID=3055593 RepID=UPI0025A88C22|nr:ion channel [Thiotrichales bacterium HSG14]